MKSNNYLFLKGYFLGFILVSFLFISIPFLSLFSGHIIRDYCFREFMYRNLCNQFITHTVSDSAKAFSIYNFVRNNTATPPKNYQVKDGNPLEILIDSFAYCNQQASLMIKLAELVEIKANLIFLYGNDSISRHSVCELRIMGKYRVFDPFYQHVFYSIDGGLASLQDIMEMNIVYSGEDSSLPPGYFENYDTKYPYRIFMSNELSFWRKINSHIFWEWHKLFADLFGKIYIYAYFYIDHSSEAKKLRLIRLAGI